MNRIAKQCNCLFSHAVKTNCYVYKWICFFTVDWNEFPARRLFCILKVARYIYFNDRILATSCFSVKTDTCFKTTDNHIQTNDKVQPLPFAKN